MMKTEKLGYRCHKTHAVSADSIRVFVRALFPVIYKWYQTASLGIGFSFDKVEHGASNQIRTHGIMPCGAPIFLLLKLFEVDCF